MQVGEAEGRGVAGGAEVGAAEDGAGAGGALAGPEAAGEAGPVDGPALGRVLLGLAVAEGEGLVLDAAAEGAWVGVAEPVGAAVGRS
ncbi:hypothetical protein GCM10009664_48510 [Kitasatospora gansuensis]